MTTTATELQILGTNQKTALNNLANKLIVNYNSLGGNLPAYDYDNISHDAFFSSPTPLIALIDKVSCLIFDRGDPLSVPVFLKRVAKGKTRDIGKGGVSYPGNDLSKEDTFLGHGHFRCYSTVYTLDAQELKALRMYLQCDLNAVETAVFVADGEPYKNLVISSKMTLNGSVAPWDKSNSRHNKFIVTVSNTDTKTAIKFDFWDSAANYSKGVIELKNEELLNAFECFVSDALSGYNSFEDFCSELGYEEDSRASERIYNSCVKALDKAKVIIDTDLYDFANELQERLN